MAGMKIHISMARMGFHSVKDALQEWVCVGSGLAMIDHWGCVTGGDQEGWVTEGRQS